MEGFFEIVDESAVRELNIVGGEYNSYRTTIDEWAEVGFYPKKGVVGPVVDEAQSREGTICLVQCSDDIIVGVCPNGLKPSTFSEANHRYPNNMIVGHVTAAEVQQKQSQSMFDEFERAMQSFMR